MSSQATTPSADTSRCRVYMCSCVMTCATRANGAQTLAPAPRQVCGCGRGRRQRMGVWQVLRGDAARTVVLAKGHDVGLAASQRRQHRTGAPPCARVQKKRKWGALSSLGVHRLKHHGRVRACIEGSSAQVDASLNRTLPCRRGRGMSQQNVNEKRQLIVACPLFPIYK